MNARTVVLSTFQISGVNPALYTTPPPAWPDKLPGEIGRFSVDFAALLDPDDVIISASITLLPDLPGCPSILLRSIVGTVVSGLLSGGRPGQTYAVTVAAATAGLSLYPATVQLAVTT